MQLEYKLFPLPSGSYGRSELQRLEDKIQGIKPLEFLVNTFYRHMILILLEQILKCYLRIKLE